MAKLPHVFQFQWTSSDSLEDKWLTSAKLMMQVSTTSLGDDARETLTIAGLGKANERSLEQHPRLRAPQTWAVLYSGVDQYLRTTVDSITTQPTPIGMGAVVSTCACCGKTGHDKSKCRLRIAKCSNCGKTGHIKTVCRQRETSSGKESSASSSSEGSGKGGKNHNNSGTCYCCGHLGHRRPDCPHRNEKCSRCGKRGRLSQFCQSGQNGNARAVEQTRIFLMKHSAKKFRVFRHCLCAVRLLLKRIWE